MKEKHEQCAIYVRCSTIEQSPELQLNDILSLNPSENRIILREQQSAWKEKAKRPEFEKLQSLIKNRTIDSVYVWNLDRIQRNRKNLKSFFELCRLYKVKVYSFCQQWLETINNTPEPFNEIIFDLFVNLLGWIAEEESSSKSSRIKLAIRKVNGKTFSHNGNKWGRKAFPKQTIKRVQDLKNEGYSIRKIASLVQVYDKNNNARNISKSAVHQILAQSNVQNDSN